MHQVQQQVDDLHRALGLNVGETPGLRGIGEWLILEEAQELAEATLGKRVRLEVLEEPAEHEVGLLAAIRELCDLVCVVYGTAVSYGIDLEPFWDEVLRANFEKRGGPRNRDGKLLKPRGWQPPNLAAIFNALYPDSEPLKCR